MMSKSLFYDFQKDLAAFFLIEVNLVYCNDIVA